MSGVLHPVGPEPAGTYWARRFLVAAVAVLLVLGVVLATTAGNGRATVTANPPPAVASSPTATPPPTRTLTPSPTVSPTGTPSQSAAPQAAPRTASSLRTGAKPYATKPAPTKPVPTKAVPRKPAPTKASPAKPRQVRPTSRPAPLCAPAELRATLTGKRRLRPEQATTFNLSLINGSKAACRVLVTRDNFELKIYSGTDRIWSTKDCGRAVRPIHRRVGSEEAVEWRLRWNGQRSQKNCEHRPEAPRPGTYFATAQLKGAEPVQLRMILRD